MIFAFKAKPVLIACSTQNLFITGSIPGIAASTKDTLVFASDPKDAEAPENNLDLLEICACISSPITISHTPVSPLICPGLKSNISVILQLLELLH